MGTEDDNIFASLEVRRDRHPEDIPRFKKEQCLETPKRLFGVCNDQFRDRGAKPAKRGLLADVWQSILHPLEQSIAAPQVVDHADGKPTHEDKDQDDNNGL